MQEVLILMDDYGTTHHLYINVSDAATRQTLITQHKTDMQTRQEQLEAYATAHGHELTSLKLANLAAKQARLKGSK